MPIPSFDDFINALTSCVKGLKIDEFYDMITPMRI